jgi:hypothetical protein
VGIWAVPIVSTVIGAGRFFHFLWIGRWPKAVGLIIVNHAEFAKSGHQHCLLCLNPFHR